MVRIHGGTGMPTRQDDDIKVYLRDIGGNSPMTRAEEAGLAERIRAGDRRALNALVQANLKFVVSACAGYRGRGLPMGDLVNEGNLGLMRAAERFDPSVGVRFISYAVWWVRQAVESALASQGRLFPVTGQRAALMRRADRAARTLSQALGREASREEIARAIGATAEDLDTCRLLAGKPLHLDRPGDGDAVDLPEAGCRPAGAEGARRWVLGRILEGMLAGLGARDRDIVRLYHGLGGEEGCSTRDLARRFGLSRRSIAVILRKAEAALRRSPAAAELRMASLALSA